MKTINQTIASGYEYEKELTRVYNRFNKHFWNNELPEVLITIIPKKYSHGYLSSAPRWVEKTKNEKV